MFSRRTRWDRSLNPLARRLRERRRAGAALLDLSRTNPTRCGLLATADDALRPLTDPAALHYDPDPLGLPAAREAVAAYYRDHGAAVDPASVVLTASTSEAYGFLFKLLAEPRDRVLVPRPGYPLFDDLATLDHVEPQPYPAGAIRGVRGGLEGGAVAAIAVHPDNPTGRYLTPGFAAEALDLCRRHGAALIVDEVFLDYPHDGAPRPTLAGRDDALCFTLSGLSKVCGLPGHKLGWIVVSGPGERRDEALARLEIVADAYLSVSTPVQHALPELLQGRHRFQAATLARLRANLALLRDQLGSAVAPVEGGWAAPIALAGSDDDQAAALRLLERGVVVHPGYLFDIAHPALVVSLLTPPAELAEAAPRLREEVARRG